jgi:hypothetical protein
VWATFQIILKRQSMNLNTAQFLLNTVTRPFFIGVTETEVAKKVKSIQNTILFKYPKNAKLAFDI